MKAKELFEKIQNGDRRALAKAITLVESSKSEDRIEAKELMKLVMPKAGSSRRIGISGIPGVGKSSFIEILGKKLISLGKKVAVLAVDPSSPVSGGSILGDKTRMEELSQNPMAFIRPSPTSGSLGGVGNKTREALFLCEAGGYDYILVETVGVGQSEYEVSSMVDLFLVLMVPNAGDELQGIKKGIIELSDLLIINKADGDTLILAENAKTQYENALHIIEKEKVWKTKVITCSSLENRGFEEILDSIEHFFSIYAKDGRLEKKRVDQSTHWLNSLFHQAINLSISQDPLLSNKFSKIRNEVQNGTRTPQDGAELMINLLIKG